MTSTGRDIREGHPRFVALSEFAWRFLVIAAAVAVLAFIVVELRLVVLPVVMALFLTSALAPVNFWLRSKRWPPLLAAWATLLGALLIIVGSAMLLAPRVADEMGDLGDTMREGSRQVIDWLGSGPLNLTEDDIDRYIDDFTGVVGDNREKIASGVVAGATAAIHIITETVLALVLTFFYLKDGPRMWAWFVGLFRADRREDVKRLGEIAWNTIGRYIRGTALIAFVDAVLIGALLFVVDVPLVVPLMVLTFFGGFFPLIGAFLAGLVAALVALVDGGIVDALIVAAGATIIQQVEGDVLQPIVMGRAVQVHPITILLSITAGAIIAGIPGAFLGVPVTAVVAKSSSYLREPRANAPSP